jgi:hypothetical protein
MIELHVRHGGIGGQIKARTPRPGGAVYDNATGAPERFEAAVMRELAGGEVH